MLVQRAKWLSVLRFLLVLGSGAYLIGLAIFLLLRLVFGSRFWWLGLINNFTPWTFLPLVVLFPLIALLGTRWLLVAATVLALICVALFGPYYVPRTHPTPIGATIRIVTFNIWPNNQDMQQVEAWLRQINADVVFLQENPRQGPNNDVASLR